MFRLDRNRRAGDHLTWKVRIFTVGAVLAMAGMYFEEEWMTGAAIVVLLTGFGLRFLPGGPEEDDGSVDAAAAEAEASGEGGDGSEPASDPFGAR